MSVLCVSRCFFQSLQTDVSIGLAGCANALLPAINDILLLLLGNVELLDEDDRLLFNEIEFVPPTTPWEFKIFGADVFSPRAGVGIAGFTKRSLVRRPYFMKITNLFNIIV